MQYKRENYSEEKYGKLISVDVNVFNEIYQSAMSKNIQFVITWIDGHDLDNPKTYYLKFKSQNDINKFNQIVTPLGITCWKI